MKNWRVESTAWNYKQKMIRIEIQNWLAQKIWCASWTVKAGSLETEESLLVGKDLSNVWDSSQEWKREGVVDDESGESTGKHDMTWEEASEIKERLGWGWRK